MAIDPTNIALVQAAVTARLEKAGCTKEELEGKNLEQLLKFAEERGITGFEVEHADAPAATETQLQEKRRHQRVKVEFANNMKAYGPAILEYLEAMKEFDAVQLAKTQADKKTLAGKKADKDARREELATELAFASKRVAVARQNLLDIEKGLGEYRDTALIEIIKQSAIAEKDIKNHADRDNTQALTFYKDKLFGQTDEVQQGVISEYERFRAEKPSEAKEEAGLDTNFAAYGIQQGPARKNENEMKKRQALQKIVVGDKDAYKAAKKADPNFDPKKPSVTYLNEKHYKAAQRYCESKGIILPEYKPGLELTGDQMKVYQDVMEEIAGIFGSRADHNEVDEVRERFGFSRADAREMIEAANVTVQKDWRGAGAAAGAAVALATFDYPGFIEKIAAVAPLIIDVPTFVPGTGGVGDTGHIEMIKKTIREGIEGKTNIHWEKLIGPGMLGTVVGTMITAIGNHDTNILKNGKTLEDAVYGELDKAVKWCKPASKKILAKFIADTRLTEEEKLAVLQLAGGLEGFKENPRELVSAIMAVKPLKDYEQNIAEIPMEEDVATSERTVYILKDGQFVDKNNKPVKMGDLVDKYGRPIEIKGNGALGIAVDKKIAALSGKAGQSKDYKITVNPNNPNDVSQIIISNDDGEVVDIEGDNIEEPDRFTLTDDSNPGHVNKYTFRKLTPEEVAASKLDPDKGPYMVLESAVGPGAKDGNIINKGKSEGKVFRYHYTQEAEKEMLAHILDPKTDEIIEDVTVKYKSPEFRLDAVEGAKGYGKSSPVYLKTGAHPKGVTTSTRTSTPTSGTGTATTPAAFVLTADFKHTVAKGESLWRVAEKALTKIKGKKPTNTEIANAMKLIAAKNNCKDVNECAAKFFNKPGQEIDLSCLK